MLLLIKLLSFSFFLFHNQALADRLNEAHNESAARRELVEALYQNLSGSDRFMDTNLVRQLFEFEEEVFGRKMKVHVSYEPLQDDAFNGSEVLAGGQSLVFASDNAESSRRPDKEEEPIVKTMIEADSDFALGKYLGSERFEYAMYDIIKFGREATCLKQCAYPAIKFSLFQPHSVLIDNIQERTKYETFASQFSVMFNEVGFYIDAKVRNFREHLPQCDRLLRIFHGEMKASKECVEDFCARASCNPAEFYQNEDGRWKSDRQAIWAIDADGCVFKFLAKASGIVHPLIIPEHLLVN